MSAPTPTPAPFLIAQVPSELDGVLLIRVLRGHLRLSRTLCRKLKQSGLILVDGRAATSQTRVPAGAKIELILLSATSPGIVPEPVPLEIVYEDADVLVVNKPAGQVVHPTGEHVKGTLANGALYHWQSRGEAASFHPVHRLDRNTSGLVLVAKHSHAHRLLDQTLRAGRVHRDYLALVGGAMEQTDGTVDQPIARLEGHAIQRGVRPDGRRAVTHFRLVRRWPAASLLHLRLETGRTHQIRVHMAFLGHPLLGDTMYGPPDLATPAGLTANRQALHAFRLEFPHPLRGDVLEFIIPLPADLAHLVAALDEGRGPWTT